MAGVPSEEITALDKYECARRELKLRQRVYPRWVQRLKMTGEEAARQTRIMAAIVRDYEELSRKERLL